MSSRKNTRIMKVSDSLSELIDDLHSFEMREFKRNGGRGKPPTFISVMDKIVKQAKDNARSRKSKGDSGLFKIIK